MENEVCLKDYMVKVGIIASLCVTCVTLCFGALNCRQLGEAVNGFMHAASLKAFERTEAGRNPEKYLTGMAASNKGLLDNPAISIGYIDTSTVHIRPDDLRAGLRQCIVGVVGLTPIPMADKVYPGTSDEIDVLIKYAFGFRILSQAHDTTYAIADLPDDNDLLAIYGHHVTKAGSKAHPLALSTQCTAFFFWRINKYVDQAKNENQAGQKPKSVPISNAMSAQDKKDVSAGETDFANSVYAGK